MTLVRLLSAVLLFFAGTAPSHALGDRFDDEAERFVRLVLAYGEHEDGYVDAYFGPETWAEEAKAEPASPQRLLRQTTDLVRDLRSAAFSSDPRVQARQRALISQSEALAARIEMHMGADLSFAEEAERLFGATPATPPLSSFDPVIARLDALVPGEGPLPARIDAYKRQFIIPEDRLDAVMRAAMDACRARTLAHIDLPKDERFTLRFVTDKPWSGYNYYQGGANSLIEVNTDLPIYIDRAVDLGCHEGYPGHHTLMIRLEENLVKDRGWIEYAVYPLFSPLSLIAEGTANAGIEMAFPGAARTAFEVDTLYPLAGLDPAGAADYAALREALRGLQEARYTIASDYFAGRITRDEAVALTEKYQLLSPERAEQSLRFLDTYGAYIINYGLGRDMVEAYIERVGGNDETARWAAFEALISEPVLPGDLVE